MRGIAKFYTWFWIIYFPVCIAFTEIVNFDWSDEILTVLLLLYAITKQRFLVKDKKRMMEINIYIGLMIFYLVYSLIMRVTTPRGVYLDFLQQLRPYAVFYLTWMMAPQFSPKQQKRIKWVMLLSFIGYLFAFKFIWWNGICGIWSACTLLRHDLLSFLEADKVESEHCHYYYASRIGLW